MVANGFGTQHESSHYRRIHNDLNKPGIWRVQDISSFTFWERDNLFIDFGMWSFYDSLSLLLCWETKKEPISPISRERSYTQKESQIGGSSRWP